MDIKIEASDLQRVARQLRQVGNPRQVRGQMVKGLKAGADPALQAVKAATARIPDKPGGPSTGLRRRARAAASVQVRTSGRTAGVKVRIPKGRMKQQAGAVTASNRLRWRHPVFGTSVQVTQKSAPGWFDSAAKSKAPAARRAAKAVLDDLERRMTHH